MRFVFEGHSIRRTMDTNYFPNVPDEVGVRIIRENKNSPTLTLFKRTFKLQKPESSKAF